MANDSLPETSERPEATPIALDTRIHAPKRLAIMAILSGTKEAEFAFLQERLNLAASDLSKQMTTLMDAGFVDTRKTGRGRGSSGTTDWELHFDRRFSKG